MAHQTTERELVDLEKQYWQAIKDKDVDAAMKLTDTECIVAGAQGVGKIGRERMGKMLENSQYVLHDFDVNDDVQVRLLRDDVAVVAYNVSEHLTVDGKRVDLKAADTSVWIRHGTKWVCALHTESLSGDPFGRDRTTGTQAQPGGKMAKPRSRHPA